MSRKSSKIVAPVIVADQVNADQVNETAQDAQNVIDNISAPEIVAPVADIEFAAWAKSRGLNAKCARVKLRKHNIAKTGKRYIVNDAIRALFA